METDKVLKELIEKLKKLNYELSAFGEGLLIENNTLRDRISFLEKKIVQIESENLELKKHSYTYSLN